MRRWWMVWSMFLAGVAVMYAVAVVLPGQPAASNPFQNLVAIIPLFISIVIRWLALPRYTNAQKAWAMYLLGLALAEACGAIGVFTGGPYRTDFVFLAVLGVVQFVPQFAQRLD